MSRRRVLCFGDSLTAGFLRGGRDFHPYSSRLQALLGDDLVWRIDHVGLSGWTTTQMVDEMDSPRVVDVCGIEWAGGLSAQLRAAATAMVIILAGTNDLADVMRQGSSLHAEGVQRVVSQLGVLHDEARAAGCTTVALTVPEHPAEVTVPDLRRVRERINAGIDGLRAEGRVSLVVDVAAGLPHSDASLWDDGLHLSASGYDRLGELVYEGTCELFQAPASASAAP